VRGTGGVHIETHHLTQVIDASGGGSFDASGRIHVDEGAVKPADEPVAHERGV
jgi:hypothetical protein